MCLSTSGDARLSTYGVRLAWNVSHKTNPAAEQMGLIKFALSTWPDKSESALKTIELNRL